MAALPSTCKAEFMKQVFPRFPSPQSPGCTWVDGDSWQLYEAEKPDPLENITHISNKSECCSHALRMPFGALPGPLEFSLDNNPMRQGLFTPFPSPPAPPTPCLDLTWQRVVSTSLRGEMLFESSALRLWQMLILYPSRRLTARWLRGRTLVTKIKACTCCHPPGHTQSWLCLSVQALSLSLLTFLFHPVCAICQVLLKLSEKGSQPCGGETGRVLPQPTIIPA